MIYLFVSIIMNTTNFSNIIIDDFYDENDCQVMCNILLGVFGGMVLLYGLFCYREICNIFYTRTDAELIEDFLDDEC